MFDNDTRATVKAAKIGALGVIIAAIIYGVFQVVVILINPISLSGEKKLIIQQDDLSILKLPDIPLENMSEYLDILEEKDKLKIENARKSLRSSRNELYNYITDYEELSGLENTQKRLLLKNLALLYQRISKINDVDINHALKINKYDNLAYISVLLSTLNESISKSNLWANNCIKSVNISIQSIQTIYNAYLEGKKEYLIFLKWLIDDDSESRLHYLKAWALAIKLYNKDQNITYKDIENEIDYISKSYLLKFPIKNNQDFRDVENEFGWIFRYKYF